MNQPISAMAAVTKNLAFAITASTSFEPPFLLAKRFSTLDHITGGRFGWNIVTSWKKAAFKAIGLDTPIEHDERYLQADEYLRVLYKLWEGSWADDAITENKEEDEYINPDKIRSIKHEGKYFNLETRHIVDPSPQRTPLLFQAGTSSAGSEFAATHAGKSSTHLLASLQLNSSFHNRGYLRIISLSFDSETEN
jgi:alkanesulfonate monooxygenase SsuD/methylene tetrahydromethanopterin reductase-like flavin-dependent oxidoreductase (luciferase family)